MCQSCDSNLSNLTTPDVYAKAIENAVQRIRKTIPNVFVNLSKSLPPPLSEYGAKYHSQ